LMTRIIVHMVKEFGIEMARIHNDSTSITFCGEYRDQAPRPDGHDPPRITHGHNKDHRPDLKQLLWTLSISADGGIPVHYNVDDGNMSDDLTHRRTWDILREITGTARFIYTADCKLCSRANMAHIVERGGWFITVLPKSRNEDGAFKRSLIERPVAWQRIDQRPSLRAAVAIHLRSTKPTKLPSSSHRRAIGLFGFAAPRSGLAMKQRASRPSTGLASSSSV